MYRFVATTKKKKNRPVFRHGMPPQGIPHKKILDPNLDTACPAGIPRKNCHAALKLKKTEICSFQEFFVSVTGTSLAFDDVENASEICLQHISPCCYTESPNILSRKFSRSRFPPKKMSDNDEVMSLTETFRRQRFSE